MTAATMTQPETEAKTEQKPDAIVKQENQPPRLVVEDSGQFAQLFDTGRFEHMWRVAQLFAKSDLVPQQYQRKPENCMIAIQMATRLEVDPFMFMQNTYIVHGRPGMEAKLAIALANARGPFVGPIQWTAGGTGKDRYWTAYATNKATGERCEFTVTWEMVTGEGWNAKSGSKWQTMPDLMGRYRAAMMLIRLYAPECIMGMLSVDEVEDAGSNLRYVESSAKPSDPDQLATMIEQGAVEDSQPESAAAEPQTIDSEPAAAVAASFAELNKTQQQFINAVAEAIECLPGEAIAAVEEFAGKSVTDLSPDERIDIKAKAIDGQL